VELEPACVETCPAEVFHFGDANDPQSPYSRFMAKHGAKTAVLKPEEKTKPSVAYKGHEKAMEKKFPRAACTIRIRMKSKPGRSCKESSRGAGA